jgi:enamine deaminase RidA (YjgF/YER057c/UK114 family)
MHETISDRPRFTDTPGDHVVSRMQHGLHYSQAVRSSPLAPYDRVEISGQGGWDLELRFPDDLGDEIARAFDNVETILREAGATWADVVAIDSFHVARPAEDPRDTTIDGAHTEAMSAQLRARMPDHRPIWTQLGVSALGAPGMRVEVRVTALVRADAATADGA